MKQTLYDILGIPQDSSFEDVEIAYAKRFAVLRSETSWESNRLVMLNEAREVLSNPERRAKYDASLAGDPARTGEQDREPAAREPATSSRMWLILVLAVAIFALVIMRPGSESETPPASQGGAGQSDATQDDLEVDEGSVEVQLQDVGEGTDAADPAQESTEQSEIESLPETAITVEVTESPAEENVVVAQSSPIVGNWECFDPVTGRISTVAFTADGIFSVQRTGEQAQINNYALTGNTVSLLDADPPRDIQIVELSADKLVLRGALDERSIVCSR